MIILGNGRIYLSKGEPIPLGCPECGYAVSYTTSPFVWCPSCNYEGDRDEFTDTSWKIELPN